MKAVAIIQARMNSSRFPGKVLADLAGKAVIDHVVDRVSNASSVDAIVLATTESPDDDAIERHCINKGVALFRGSENDVLDRFYRAATQAGADIVIRITADCPLIDPAVIDRVVKAFQQGEYDYVSNTIPPTFPDGLDTEVFTMATLERAWKEATLTSEREHVTPYIWKQPDLFRLHNVTNDLDLSHLRWTVDEPGDLAFIRKLFNLGESSFDMSTAQVLHLLDRHADLFSQGDRPTRNEGYAKSLREDSLATGEQP